MSASPARVHANPGSEHKSTHIGQSATRISTTLAAKLVPINSGTKNSAKPRNVSFPQRPPRARSLSGGSPENASTSGSQALIPSGPVPRNRSRPIQDSDPGLGSSGSRSSRLQSQSLEPPELGRYPRDSLFSGPAETRCPRSPQVALAFHGGLFYLGPPATGWFADTPPETPRASPARRFQRGPIAPPRTSRRGRRRTPGRLEQEQREGAGRHDARQRGSDWLEKLRGQARWPAPERATKPGHGVLG